MGTITTILILALYVLIIASGIYFKSYFNKKGENLATKEDFKDLKAQTAELRQATKEIEAKIDDQVWNRQRHWEMKKEIFIEAAGTIAKADETLARSVSAYLNGRLTRDDIDKCEEYWYQLSAQGSSIMIVADAKTIEISSSVVKAFIDTVMALKPNEDNRVDAEQKFNQFRTLRAGLLIFTRKELGIELGPLPASQSNESQAAPIEQSGM